MIKDKDASEDKQKLPPGSVYINIGQQEDIDLINLEKQQEKSDISRRSERVEREKWTILELPRRAAKPTSVGYPLGPWIIPYEQAQQCYIYGFYRAAIAMSGSIAESMCLTILYKKIGYEKKYEEMTLGKLINEIGESVTFSEQQNLCRLKEINKIRNKWLHIKSDDFFADIAEALKQEESVTKLDAERILVLVHETLGSIFEIRPASRGMVRILINAQRKQ